MSTAPFPRAVPRAAGLAVLLAGPVLAQPCPIPSFDDTLRLPMPQVGALGPGSVRAELAPADLDRDGATDLVILETTTGSLYVYRGRRDRDFGPPRRLETPLVTALHAAIALEGTVPTDLLVETAAGTTVLAGDGASGWQERPVTGIDPAFPPELWRFADLDGDGRLDVVVAAGGAAPSLESFLGDGRGGFRRGASTPLAGVAPGTATSSLTLVLGEAGGDGRPDAVVSAYFPSGLTPPGAVLVLHGDGKGGFGRAVKVQDGPGTVEIGDLDGDARPDLLVRTLVNPGRDSSGIASVAWGEGSGGFSPPQVVVPALAHGSFRLADVDGDGRLDLLSGGQTARLSVQHFEPGRTLGPAIPLSEVTGDSAPWLIVDADGDGRADLAALPAYFPEFKLFVNRCDGSTFAKTFVVPVVVSVRGVGDTLFTSELVLTNRGARDVTVELKYTAARGGGSGTASVGLPAGRQRVLPDAVAWLRTLGIPIPGGEGRVGSLRVRFTGASSPADVSVDSRVRSPFARGEVGVGVDPVPLLGALTGPSVVPLLRENSVDRTNLALVSLAADGEPDVTLRVHLFPTDGRTTGPVVLTDVTLAPGAFVQLDRVLAAPGVGMASAWARIERVKGEAPYAAWAVLNDEASGDGSVVTAVRDTPNFTQGPLLVPTVAETDRFTTELVLTNTVDDEMKASLTFASPALGSANHREKLEVAVPPGAQVSLPGFAGALCAKWAGTAGGATPCAGMLTIAAYGGVHAVTRTTARGESGRFGVAVQARPLPYALDAACWLDGIQQDEEHRTNLGLVNTSFFNPARYRLDVFDGDSGRLAATVAEVEVDTGGWKQLNELLATAAPGVSNAYVRVTSAGGFPIAYGVVNDGPGAGQGNGDGTLRTMKLVPR